MSGRDDGGRLLLLASRATRPPSRDLTLLRVRALQEVLTAPVFVTRPHYLHTNAQPVG